MAIFATNSKNPITANNWVDIALLILLIFHSTIVGGFITELFTNDKYSSQSFKSKIHS